MDVRSLRGMKPVRTICFWVFAPIIFACLGLSQSFGQCSYKTYVRADTYQQFAIANNFGRLATDGTMQYDPTMEPTNDKDGDGLPNEEEWAGWTSVVNGVPTYFGWRATSPGTGLRAQFGQG